MPAASSEADEIVPALYVTDSAEIWPELRRRGLPAVGWLHDDITADRFPGAKYLVEDPEEIDGDSWTKMLQRLTGQPWTIAQTERLWIREMTPEDLDALCALYDDPAARRFLEPPRGDRAEQEQILRAYIEKVYGLYGFGVWAVCDSGSGELIGRVGFSPPSAQCPLPELGFLIRRDRRGQGLAGEAARAALRFAKEEAGFAAVSARADGGNAPSIALLRGLGFEEVDGPDADGIHCFRKVL